MHETRIRELGAEPLAQHLLERYIVSRAGYLDPERSRRTIAGVKLRLSEGFALRKQARNLVELATLGEQVMRGARQTAVGDPRAIDRSDRVGPRGERTEDCENERRAQGIEYPRMSSTEGTVGLAVKPNAAAGIAAGWPWRQGNRFRLLAESDRIFRRMLEAIAAARESVLLEMYLVESGTVARRFIDALAGCAQRGVRVHVLFDGFGSLALRAADRRRLSDSGAHLTFFNPLSLRKRLQNFLRDHRKLLVIDGALAFVGGVGLADEFIDGTRGRLAWRDFMLEISGPVVSDWTTAFARNWSRSSGTPAIAEAAPEPPDEAAIAAGALGRLALSEAGHRSLLANDVVRRINGAQRRAWIMSAYFVPSRRFRKGLRRAARRGVDVRLLVPGPKTDHPWVRHAARRFYGKMLRSGVRIFEYQPRVLHGKMTLCDDWVSLGSSNLDRWSFRWNLEANQEIESAALAAEAAGIFAADCEESLQLSRRHWRRRAVLDRVRESIAGALDRILDRWRRPRDG